MSHVYDGPLATYNSLTDPNLSGFFGNARMKRHLKKAGLVSRRGVIVSENQYRLNMARKEHKKHVRDLLAQAIVHKTLDLERYRQVEIRHKLEEIAKIEMVRRVRSSRGRKGDEEILPYLTPHSHSRPQSERPMEKSSKLKRPNSAPAPPRGRNMRRQHDIAQSCTDRNTVSPPPSLDRYSRQPMSPSSDRHSEHRMSLSPLSDRQSGHRAPSPLSSGRSSFKDTLKHLQPDSIDTRHLYALDSEALHQFALHQSQIKQGHDGTSSPYLISQGPIPPRWKRAKSAHSPKRTSRIMSAKPEVSDKRGNDYKGGLMLHRQEPAMMHQGEVQTLCEITMKYYGPNLTLPRDQADPTQQITIEQQHCGGNTLPVFMERLTPGSTFSFISRRHRGFPFSLTIYIDSRVDCRVSTCCEYKHAVGVKLGGKMGHFSLAGISGATPCYKCKLTAQAPPRRIKVRKAAAEKKEPATLEEVTVNGAQRSPVIEKKKTEKHEGSDESGEEEKGEDSNVVISVESSRADKSVRSVTKKDKFQPHPANIKVKIETKEGNGISKSSDNKSTYKLVKKEREKKSKHYSSDSGKEARMSINGMEDMREIKIIVTKENDTEEEAMFIKNGIIMEKGTDNENVTLGLEPTSDTCNDVEEDIFSEYTNRTKVEDEIEEDIFNSMDNNQVNEVKETFVLDEGIIKKGYTINATTHYQNGSSGQGKMEAMHEEYISHDADSKDADNYEDDFENDSMQVSDKKLDDIDGKSNKRYILGLKEDETRVKGKTVQVDVTEKDDQDMEDSVQHNQSIEGYSSEDEDLEGPLQNSVAVMADVHEVKWRTKSLSSSSSTSSSSSSSSSSEDKSKKGKSPEQQKTVLSTKPQDASKVHSDGSNTPLSERTDYSTTSTSSQSLTTESEMKQQDTPRSEEKVARKRSSLSSSSSTVTSDSDNEKYQRKVREEKLKQGNENKNNKDSDVKKTINDNDKFEDRMKMDTEKKAVEVDRKERFEYEEQKRKTWEDERKKQYDLLRQQSEERLQNMKEERKQSEMNRDGELAKKKAEEDQRKAEERRKRLEEEERMKKDYVKQLSLIQSQRDSNTSTSVTTATASDEAKPLPKADTSSNIETPHYKPVFSHTTNNVEGAERKMSVPAVSNLYTVENANNIAPGNGKRLEIKSSLKEKDSDTDSSSDSSSTSSGDNEQNKRKSPIMQVIKTVPASDVKSTGRSSSTSSTSTISSSSGGEYMVNKVIKPKLTPTEVIPEGTDASKSQTENSAAEIDGPVSTYTQRSPLSSVADSDTGSENESHFQIADVQTDSKYKELTQTDTRKVLVQNDATNKPTTLQSTSVLSSDSSTDDDDNDEYHPARIQTPPSIEAESKAANMKTVENIEEEKVLASGTVSESAGAKQAPKNTAPNVLYPEVQKRSNINISESSSEESEQPIDLASNHRQFEPAPFGGLQREKSLEVIERNWLSPSQEPKTDKKEDSEDSSFESSESSSSWESEQVEDNKTDTVGLL